LQLLEISNRELIQDLAIKYFDIFFNYIFSESIEKIEGKFVRGWHIDKTCRRMQNQRRTVTVGPRKHIKSTIFYGYLAWQIYRMAYPLDEWFYLSYKDDLSQYHLKKVKRYIAVNSYFEHIENMTKAETILHYRKGNNYFICEPEGILSFKRGRHPRGVLCDDILQDPISQKAKLDISQILKINEIFFKQVTSLPKEGGELHIVGTPQDESDLFFELKKHSGYDWQLYQAIINYAKKEVLWPEMFPFERLIEIRDNEVGHKAFQTEYQCVPVRSEEAYFMPQEIDSVINPRRKPLNQWVKYKLNKDIFAGLDIGKKRHPSHLAVFAVKNNKLVQILSKWMDNWDYIDQLDHCELVIENLKVDKLKYDNTRAEFEGFNEEGKLPTQMEPETLTSKMKHQLAVEFEKMVKNKTIELLPDQRQKRQILTVDNDLNAPETAEGHGDSFWSICLAIKAYLEGQGVMIWGL